MTWKCRRSRASIPAVLAAILVAGCGTPDSASLTLGNGGLHGSVVITSDKTAIVSLRNAVIAAQQSDGGIYDGSHPVGAHVCGFSFTKQGHSYQVDVYGSVPNSSCDSAAQTGFINSVP